MTQAEGKIQYFLGANSAQGFVSLYHELLDERDATALYVLKGGAGCGKSTLMKKVGEEMERQGFDVEYVLCSGDPDSLDAILIPEKAVAIMDGTAPHGKRTKAQKVLSCLKPPENIDDLGRVFFLFGCNGHIRN